MRSTVSEWNSDHLSFMPILQLPLSFLNKPEIREMLINKMKEGVECFKRTGVKWALVVPGRYDEKLHRDFQTANVIDNLRYCCDIVEPAGLTIVLEPLNTLRNHPGSLPYRHSTGIFDLPGCQQTIMQDNQ